MEGFSRIIFLKKSGGLYRFSGYEMAEGEPEGTENPTNSIGIFSIFLIRYAITVPCTVRCHIPYA